MEVKRKANVGEYIKVIDGYEHSNEAYKNGDICKVLSIREEGVFAKTNGTHPCNIGIGTSYLYDSEYEVSENEYSKEENAMTKSDLRTGMVVEDRDGYIGIVLKSTATVDGIKWFLNDDGEKISMWEELDDEYNEDLTGTENFNSGDIVKIYQPHNFDDYTTMKAYSEEYLIWEREQEVKEITMKDIEEKFGCKVKIVG